MKLIIASNNKGKIKEFKALLEPFGYEVLSQSEAGVNIEVEETGTTFAENSALKAKAIFDATENCAVLADDSGLSSSSAASDVYKRQLQDLFAIFIL